MGYLYLTLAVIFEVCGTTSLKYTNGFTNLIPSLIFIICYGISFYSLSLSLKTIDLAVAYAIWGAVGIAIISAIGFFVFHETFNWIKIISILFIIIGVIGVRLSSSVS